jgi:transposase
MRYSGEFLQKISSPTTRYATQLKAIQYKMFWSTLCYAAQHKVHSAMLRSAESTHIREYLCKSETKFENITIISDLGRVKGILVKKLRFENLVRLSL